MCGCSSHAKPSSSLVPWVDRPLPPYSAPQPKLVRYPTTAPPCRAGELRARRGQEGAAAGNDSEPVYFTNAGSRSCLLRGFPVVMADTPGGRRELRPRHGTFFGAVLPADIAPGSRGYLDFGTSSGCKGGIAPLVRYRNLAFTLPHGGTLSTHVSITAQCGLDMSALGLPARYTPLKPAPGTVGTLEARVELPQVVRAGATLRYAVLLTNPTGTAVGLRPCPGYTESFFAPPHSIVHRSFALNCDGIRAIPAHGHVRYAMQLSVPRAARAGIAKLGWSLNTPNGPFAGTALRLRAG